MISNIYLEQHRYSAVNFARNERYRTTYNAEMLQTVAMATVDSTSSAVIRRMTLRSAVFVLICLAAGGGGFYVLLAVKTLILHFRIQCLL